MTPPELFDPARPLGATWSHDATMTLHSAIVVTLETMGWHPCPAIKAAWEGVGAITTLYKLVEQTPLFGSLVDAELSEDEQTARDQYVADEIRASRCPFGSLPPGKPMAFCPSGFPGCACADEFELNPCFQKERDERDEQYGRYLDCGPLAWDDREGGEG